MADSNNPQVRFKRGNPTQIAAQDGQIVIDTTNQNSKIGEMYIDLGGNKNNDRIKITDTDKADNSYVVNELNKKQNSLQFDGVYDSNANKVATVNSFKSKYITSGRKSGTTLGYKATAEGQDTTASGEDSHAEGYKTIASGAHSHAEGQQTTASSGYSHAEGYLTKASSSTSHAEGESTEASKNAAHAEGHHTIASGAHSHAEGNYTTASGENSHASGDHTIANQKNQTVVGKYNNITNTNNLFVVGNGTSQSDRSNAFEVDIEGKCKAEHLTNDNDDDHVLVTKDYVNKINDKMMPGTNALTNPLTNKSYVDDSVNSITAYYITKNASGDAFSTYSELTNTTEFWSGGIRRTPIKNDYCIVRADEGHSGATTKYIYNSQWEFLYIINESPLTPQQIAALNSGITSTILNNITTDITNIENVIPSSTSLNNQLINNQELNIELTTKQDNLVSGANIKTINGNSILGEGNLNTNYMFKYNYSDFPDQENSKIEIDKDEFDNIKILLQNGTIVIFHYLDDDVDYTDIYMMAYKNNQQADYEIYFSGFIKNQNSCDFYTTFMYSDESVDKAYLNRPIKNELTTKDQLNNKVDKMSNPNQNRIYVNNSGNDGYKIYSSRSTSDTIMLREANTGYSKILTPSNDNDTTYIANTGYVNDSFTKNYITSGQHTGTNVGEGATIEGIDNEGSGYCSHAEGYSTTASGWDSHTEGYWTTASGDYSHSGGYGTIADQDYQTAIGKFNLDENEGNLFSVGNGEEETLRSNAFEVNNQGVCKAGKNFIASESTTSNDNALVLTTKDYVDNKVSVDTVTLNEEEDEHTKILDYTWHLGKIQYLYDKYRQKVTVFMGVYDENENPAWLTLSQISINSSNIDTIPNE